MESKPKVAVIGSGYWGKNLVRNFHQLGALAMVCDTRDEVLREAEEKYKVKTTKDFDAVIKDKNIQAVVIAAPASQHYQLTKRAIQNGKDVYVEKPLALDVREGEELLALAKKNSRMLMVGHILQYHPAVVELKRMVRSGELGRIRYIYSSRLNLGKVRTEENILWSFAPHDISAILYLLNEMPVSLASHGGSFIHQQVADTTLTTCQFKSGVMAHIFVSWIHPFKEQKLTIVGDKAMAVFDDMEPERKLVLYTHRIDWIDRAPVAHKEAAQVVDIPKLEPLRLECEHFLNSVETRETPRTDGQNGVDVLRILQACEDSVQKGGKPVELVTAAPKYFAHPTAIVDEPCEIGEGTKIWHFSHIMANSKLGKKCNLGQNVVISPDVTIGNNVKIQNNVSVYTGVILEDDVFCGPSMVFTNVVNPRSHVLRRDEYRQTLVKRGASFGANSTVVCGHTVGKFAFIAAGAVVAKDVPDYALMAGVPAKRIGWMCNCGIRLNENGGHAECSACGRQYQIANGVCSETGQKVVEADVALSAAHD